MGMHRRGKNKWVMGKDVPFQFGKYKGNRLRDIIACNPKYVDWCIRNIEWSGISKAATEVLNYKLSKLQTKTYCSYIDPEYDQIYADAFGY